MYEDEYVLEERVDRLEVLLGRFIVNTDTALTRLAREMKDFKDEMKVFKDEMKDFKDETTQDRRQMNKQWGDLANKMGTIVEDIIVPAIRPVIQKYFGQDIDYLSIKVKRKNKAMNLKGEFDVIGVTETSVFLVETKSSPNEEYLFKFIEHINLFRKLFPEYKDKPVIPIFASLRFDEDLIRLCSAKNIYVLAYREWDYMDILNFDDVVRSSENIRQKYI